MDAEENPEVGESPESQRRAYPRFEVDEDASLLLVSHESWHSCKVVDLSLEGCRVCTRERFQAGTGIRVEIKFKINGIVFRLSGTTQWTDHAHAVGIHFCYPTLRRREELEEVLGEVKAAQAAAAQREVEEALAQQLTEAESSRETEERDTAPIAELTKLPAKFVALEQLRTQERAEAKPQSPSQEAAPETRPAGRERRTFSRQAVDTSAEILLINVGCAVRGRIQDLSLGGCRIRTDEQFPVGIYTRVETEFRVEGLPFRLGGVIQGIHDRNLVGIRFLDMSIRKREQVEQLIEELEMLHAGHKFAEGGV
jgi:hypothetical protein